MPKKTRILIVDDSDDGRDMLVEYLTFREFRVEAACDGAEAIDVARRFQPHIILMDLSMPTVDGWEATRRLKADKRTKEAVIVAVTAHAFRPEREAARLAGCAAVIVKPFDLGVLAEALERAMSEGLPALTTVAAKPSRRQTTTAPRTGPLTTASVAPSAIPNDAHVSRNVKPARSPRL
jgi:CheY-like chemotaxis protein